MRNKRSIKKKIKSEKPTIPKKPTKSKKPTIPKKPTKSKRPTKPRKSTKTKQKGGGVGTSGKISTFIDDVGALINTTVNMMVNTGELLYDVWELPNDFTKKIPYKNPGAPGSDL